MLIAKFISDEAQKYTIYYSFNDVKLQLCLQHHCFSFSYYSCYNYYLHTEFQYFIEKANDCFTRYKNRNTEKENIVCRKEIK